MSNKSKNAKTARKSNQPTQELTNLRLKAQIQELSKYAADLFTGLERAGRAIARLERFQFATTQLLLQKGVMTYPEMTAAIEELLKSDDLEVYWGVKAPPEPEAADTPAEETDEKPAE